MAESTKLNAEIRKPKGTRAARRIRADGRLPAVIYGHGRKPVSVSLEAHDVHRALDHGAHVVHVEYDGKSVQCLIKEVQYGHLGDNLMHLDLARVTLSERVQVTIGVELKGTPKGLSEGGLLEQPMADVEIECLVTEIPEVIRPNVAGLHVGDSLYVRDLDLPPSGTPVSNPDDVVATVRALAVAEAEEEEAAEEEAAESAEPEVIGKAREAAEEPES